MNETWTAWHKDEGDDGLPAVVTADNERAAITAANELRLPGRVLVLPSADDPNTPRLLPPSGPRHYTGTSIEVDPPVVRRGQGMERLFRRRVQR